MKLFITILFFLISITAFGQTKYYTTDGKNRMTESEIKTELTEMESKMEKALGKKIYASLAVQETETKKDSIISKVTFTLSDEMPDELVTLEPLSELRDKEFPHFDLNTLTAKKINSNQLKGKPTMINFWFTRCLPCIDEMPVLNKMAEEYKDDFNFIAITYEEEEDVKNFLKKHPFNFTHLVNAEKFISQLGVKSYPMNLFLDKNGVLKFVKGGISYESTDGDELIIGGGHEIIEIIEQLK